MSPAVYSDRQSQRCLLLWMFAQVCPTFASQRRGYAASAWRRVIGALRLSGTRHGPQLAWKVPKDDCSAAGGLLVPLRGYVTLRPLREDHGKLGICRDAGCSLKRLRNMGKGDGPLDLGMTHGATHCHVEEKQWATRLALRATSTLLILLAKHEHFDIPTESMLIWSCTCLRFPTRPTFTTSD